MSTPKLRMVAGPNGSGKTTLLNSIGELGFPMGHQLNPDQVAAELAQTGRMEFSQWGLSVDQQIIHAFTSLHALGGAEMARGVSIDDNTLVVAASARDGYLGAVLCEFMREQWVSQRQSFTFETVMSSPEKIDLLRRAREMGYRTYLYFICTDSPIVNRERIASRVTQGGHDVPAEKIEPRYVRSLALLPQAIQNSDRAFLFDNSGKSHRHFAEFEDGRLVVVSEEPPAWFFSPGLDAS
jgi:predicted ABC-type ATPase